MTEVHMFKKRIGSDDLFFPNSGTMGQPVKLEIRLAQKETFCTKHRTKLWNSFGTQHSGDQKYVCPKSIKSLSEKSLSLAIKQDGPSPAIVETSRK